MSDDTVNKPTARNNRYILAAWLIRMAQALERGVNTGLVAKKLRVKAGQIRPK